MKIELVIVPLSPLQKTAPPTCLLAELLIKLQLLKIPLLPLQKTAPPFPFWKLKFHENKKINKNNLFNFKVFKTKTYARKYFTNNLRKIDYPLIKDLMTKYL